jgi:transposase
VTDAHVQHNCRPYAGVTKGKCKVGRVLLYYI